MVRLGIMLLLVQNGFRLLDELVSGPPWRRKDGF
jgi:hypothetical protein